MSHFSMLAEKLNMSPEDAERWIVNLIRNATLDAKIPKALWKDLKAAGLLHQDAPVPR